MTNSHHPVSFQGNALTLVGHELKVGDTLPEFTVTGVDMTDFSASKFRGSSLIILSMPSLDTSVCALETKRFNEEVSKLGSGATVLAVTMDLPFAQKRWCGAEGVNNVVTASDYKHRSFGEAVGAQIKEWGLLTRAVFVADPEGKIVYSEYVPEIPSEPNYEAALSAVKKTL